MLCGITSFHTLKRIKSQAASVNSRDEKRGNCNYSTPLSFSLAFAFKKISRPAC
jgi:hypothetical protein